MKDFDIESTEGQEFIKKQLASHEYLTPDELQKHFKEILVDMRNDYGKPIAMTVADVASDALGSARKFGFAPFNENGATAYLEGVLAGLTEADRLLKEYMIKAAEAEAEEGPVH